MDKSTLTGISNTSDEYRSSVRQSVFEGEPLQARRDPIHSRTQPEASHSWLSSFVERWGWRVYAVPVLMLLSALYIVDISKTSTTHDSVELASPSAEPTPGLTAPPTMVQKVPVISELPPGAEYTFNGAGTYRTVGQPAGKIGEGTTKLFTYAIAIEDGVDTSVFGGDDSFVNLVNSTLADAKGWTADKAIAFGPVAQPQDTPDFTVALTSPQTVRELCGYEIQVETSCNYPPTKQVLLNLSRWVRGAKSFQGDLGLYRQYLINHEVGHAIGLAQHEKCPQDGALAPIMMQQSLAMSNRELAEVGNLAIDKNDNSVCRPNGWPFPNGTPQ